MTGALWLGAPFNAPFQTMVNEDDDADEVDACDGNDGDDDGGGEEANDWLVDDPVTAPQLAFADGFACVARSSFVNGVAVDDSSGSPRRCFW